MESIEKEAETKEYGRFSVAEMLRSVSCIGNAQVVAVVNRKGAQQIRQTFLDEIARRPSVKPDLRAKLSSGEIEPEISLAYYPAWAKSEVTLRSFDASWKRGDSREYKSYYGFDRENTGLAPCTVPGLKWKEVDFDAEKTEKFDGRCEYKESDVRSCVSRAEIQALDALKKEAEACVMKNNFGCRSVWISSVNKTSKTVLVGFVPVYLARFTYRNTEYVSRFSGFDDECFFDFPVRVAAAGQSAVTGVLGLFNACFAGMLAVYRILQYKSLTTAFWRFADVFAILLSVAAVIIGAVAGVRLLKSVSNADDKELNGIKKRLILNLVTLGVLLLTVAVSVAAGL